MLEGGLGEPTGQIDSSIDVDALYNQIESEGAASREIPMTAPPEQPKADPKPQTVQEYEFTANGKPIKAPIDKILQWASQGYDYPQKMAQLKQQAQEFEQKQQLYQQWEKKYKPIDEYIQENPDWWNHVEESWNNRTQTALDPNNPLSKEFANLKNELGELRKFKEEISNERLNQKRQSEDEKLSTEIKSIRDQFQNLDFDQVDASGKTLEFRILEHAQANGISSFKAAFRDFYHDHLMKLAEERGKEAVQKDIQKKTKLGLLGTSPTPRKGLNDADNVKAKSYEALMQEALDELGIGA